MDHPEHPVAWTPSRVEARLIAAFRAMPACPVFGVGSRLQAAPIASTIATPTATGPRGAALIEVLRWAALLDDSPTARTYLWAWARCRATGDSFGALCAGMGWRRTNAETGRRQAAALIATRLDRRPANRAAPP